MGKFMKTFRILVLFGLVSLLVNSQTQATNIYLPTPVSLLPDLTGSQMYVAYNASTYAFVASGYTSDYNDLSGDVGAYSPSDTSYYLSATINNLGNLTGGALTISGDIGAGDTTLLTANLVTGAAGTAFGYGDGSDNIFQFLFNVTGGSLESAFGGHGAGGGIVLSAEFGGNPGDTPFTGSWFSSFNNNGSDSPNGAIDSFAVPEPSSILLVLVGGVLLAGARRCRQKTLGVDVTGSIAG
jgi:hypothetical protein